MNKEDEELCWSDCSGSGIVNNCNKRDGVIVTDSLLSYKTLSSYSK